MLASILSMSWAAGSIGASISQSNTASWQWSNRTYQASVATPQSDQSALWSEKLSWTLVSSSTPEGWSLKSATGSSVGSSVTSVHSVVASSALDSVTAMPSLSDILSYNSVAVSDAKESLSPVIPSSSTSWSPAITNIVSKVTASVAGFPFAQSPQSITSTTKGLDPVLSPTSGDASNRSQFSDLPTVSCIACSDDTEGGSGGGFSTDLLDTVFPTPLLDAYEKTTIHLNSVQRTLTAMISSYSSRTQWSSQPAYLQDPAFSNVYSLTWQATGGKFSTERVTTTPIVQLEAPNFTTSPSGTGYRSHQLTDTRNEGLTKSADSTTSDSSSGATDSRPPSTTTTSTSDATQSSKPGTVQDNDASRSYQPSGKSAGIAVGATVSAIGVGVIIYCVHPKRRQRRKKGTIWIGYSDH